MKKSIMFVIGMIVCVQNCTPAASRQHSLSLEEEYLAGFEDVEFVSLDGVATPAEPSASPDWKQSPDKVTAIQLSSPVMYPECTGDVNCSLIAVDICAVLVDCMNYGVLDYRQQNKKTLREILSPVVLFNAKIDGLRKNGVHYLQTWISKQKSSLPVRYIEVSQDKLTFGCMQKFINCLSKNRELLAGDDDRAVSIISLLFVCNQITSDNQWMRELLEIDLFSKVSSKNHCRDNGRSSFDLQRRYSL